MFHFWERLQYLWFLWLLHLMIFQISGSWPHTFRMKSFEFQIVFHALRFCTRPAFALQQCFQYLPTRYASLNHSLIWWQTSFSLYHFVLSLMGFFFFHWCNFLCYCYYILGVAMIFCSIVIIYFTCCTYACFI